MRASTVPYTPPSVWVDYSPSVHAHGLEISQLEPVDELGDMAMTKVVEYLSKEFIHVYHAFNKIIILATRAS